MSGLISCVVMGVIANIHPSVAVPGASHNRGCLIQFNGFDPARPTIVVTHGFNPLVRKIRLNHDACFAAAIRRRCGDRFNLLGWDWNAVSFQYWIGRRNTQTSMDQGRLLACELQRIGANPRSTWLIGHSLGAVVMASATYHWSNATGCPVRQVTMLDAVCVQHRFIFCKYQLHRRACHVENYWAGGRSGVGRISLKRGVYSKRTPGRAPFSAWFVPRGNHAYSVEWYYNSICRGCGNGFPRGLSCFCR